jgi:hypothetical protein
VNIVSGGDQDVLAVRAVDGILAAHFRLPDPAALANTLIDYLHIAGGVAFRIRLEDSSKHHGGPVVVRTGVRVAGRELALEAFPSVRAKGDAERVARTVERIACIVRILKKQHGQLWRGVESQIVDAFACPTQCPPSMAQIGDTQPRLLTRITERIRQSLAEYEQSGSPREVFLAAHPGHLRIVIVHRFFRDGVPFGRLVFAQSQADMLSSDGGAADPLLAAPLADFPPAIQHCFERGFALYGSWLCPESAPAFAAVVKRAVGLKPEGPVPNACFIPCHVGGVAWTVLAVITSTIDLKFADLCLRLYREWIPRVFEALRTSAQADFLSWLLESYQRGLASPTPVWSTINNEWACIRATYPLPRWDLEVARTDYDDQRTLRLPKIRGQEWAIGRHGTANEYYRPPNRLSQPASWGSGSLWGETLLQRMIEVTASTAQSDDLHRLRAAQQSVGSWAHEVKSYTTPIISDLRSALRSTEVSAPAYRPTSRALQAAVVLNACSFAAQKILENRGTPCAEMGIFRLPLRGCEDIVEATLQYLLQYWRSASPVPLNLQWEPQMSEREALIMLARALGARDGSDGAIDDEETVLTHPAVVGVVSLLREAVFNIRCTKPIEDPIVRLRHRLSREDTRLTLILEQLQQERIAWSMNPDQPKGLERANRLYGPEGAQLGHITSHCPEQVPVRGGVSIKYVVEVEFNLATQSA